MVYYYQANFANDDFFMLRLDVSVAGCSLMRPSLVTHGILSWSVGVSQDGPWEFQDTSEIRWDSCWMMNESVIYIYMWYMYEYTWLDESWWIYIRTLIRLFVCIVI